MMSKRISENVETWDIYLSQVLAAIKFNTNDSTKFPPFYLLYNCDPLLPIYNILKPRHRYYGEESHKIGLQQQHISFVLGHRHLKKAKKTHSKYANKNSGYTEFQVGDPVYLKQQQRKSKLEGRWCPYYRIIEKTSPVSLHLKNHLDGSVTKAHAENIRLANIDNWEIHKDRKGRLTRRFVAPLSSSSDEGDNELSDDERNLSKTARKYRREREMSSHKDNIPLMELAERVRDQEFAEAYSPSEDQKPINKVNAQKQANDTNVKNLL